METENEKDLQLILQNALNSLGIIEKEIREYSNKNGYCGMTKNRGPDELYNCFHKLCSAYWAIEEYQMFIEERNRGIELLLDESE